MQDAKKHTERLFQLAEARIVLRMFANAAKAYAEELMDAIAAGAEIPLELALVDHAASCCAELQGWGEAACELAGNTEWPESYHYEQEERAYEEKEFNDLLEAVRWLIHYPALDFQPEKLSRLRMAYEHFTRSLYEAGVECTVTVAYAERDASARNFFRHIGKLYGPESDDDGPEIGR